MEVTSINCICNGSRGTDCDYCGGMGYRLKYSTVSAPTKFQEINPTKILELQILIDWKHVFFSKYRNIMYEIIRNEAKPEYLKGFKPIFRAFIDQMLAIKNNNRKDIDKILIPEERKLLNIVYEKICDKPILKVLKKKGIIEKLNERKRKKK